MTFVKGPLLFNLGIVVKRPPIKDIGSSKPVTLERKRVELGEPSPPLALKG